MVVFNRHDGRHACCGDHLESEAVKTSLAANKMGWISIHQCPRCLKIWKRVNNRWVLLDKSCEDPFKV